MFKEILKKYIESLYRDNCELIQAYGKTTYVYEYYKSEGWCFKHLSYDEVEKYIDEHRLYTKDMEKAKLFVTLPGTYTPGKYIDIGYYDAIDKKEVNICSNDIVLVIGFGAGLDLIHVLQNASFAYGVEINPFAVASAKTNLRIAGLENLAKVEWGDVRDYAKGLKRIQDMINKKVSKLLWSMPYESTSSKKEPCQLKDFFDNYCVIDWFSHFLTTEDFLAPKWSALLWNTVDGLQSLESYFNKEGFDVMKNEVDNICIVSNISN